MRMSVSRSACASQLAEGTESGLAQHDDVRVLAHDMAQRFLESHVELRIDRALRDAVDHVLHRVLGGDDAGVVAVEIVDRADGEPGRHPVDGLRIQGASRLLRDECGPLAVPYVG